MGVVSLMGYVGVSDGFLCAHPNVLVILFKRDSGTKFGTLNLFVSLRLFRMIKKLQVENLVPLSF